MTRCRVRSSACAARRRGRYGRSRRRSRGSLVALLERFRQRLGRRTRLRAASTADSRHIERTSRKTWHVGSTSGLQGSSQRAMLAGAPRAGSMALSGPAEVWPPGYGSVARLRTGWPHSMAATAAARARTIRGSRPARESGRARGRAGRVRTRRAETYRTAATSPSAR